MTLDGENPAPESHSDYKPVDRFDASAVHHLSGMYQNWFLDYASYVILERAVPHIEDGLKPVQRRILHSMKRMDDGRYNKVANIVGHTMQFHPPRRRLHRRRPCAAGAEGPARRHTGQLGQHPHGRPRRRAALHRGEAVQVCARHGVQPQDHRLAAELRRPQPRAYNAAGEVPAAARTRGGSASRWASARRFCPTTSASCATPP